MFTNYRYAYMLYKMGSFTKAAEALFISQPALSVAIKNIEASLGAELFERTGRGVRLTPAGKVYMTVAEQLINMENELKTQIQDINCLEAGSVIVGGSNYLSSYVLPKIINEFTTLHPKIDVSLVEANSAHLMQELREEQVDVIVENVENEADCERVPLVREQILLCVPQDRPINKELAQYSIHPNDIYHRDVNLNTVDAVPIRVFRDESFVLLKPGNDMHERAMTLFAENDMEPKIPFQVDQLNISYALSESGVGVSFITDTLFKHARFRDNVLLYRVEGMHSRMLYIIYKRKKYLSRAMAEFIRVAQNVVK